MNETKTNIDNETKIEDLEVGMGGLILVMIIGFIILGYFTYTNGKSTDATNTKIESISSDVASTNSDLKAMKHDTKQNQTELSIFRATVYDEINEIKIAKSAKIYNLEITVCKENLLTNSIDKRFIRMDNVVAINPSVDRTAITVDTGIDYNGVIIPGVLEDEKSYACNLHIISVR